MSNTCTMGENDASLGLSNMCGIERGVSAGAIATAAASGRRVLMSRQTTSFAFERHARRVSECETGHHRSMGAMFLSTR